MGMQDVKEENTTEAKDSDKDDDDKVTEVGKSFLDRVQKNNENKYAFFKDILKNSYPQLFVGGFALEEMDERLKHLSTNEKS